jgi:hypothetical protein
MAIIMVGNAVTVKGPLAADPQHLSGISDSTRNTPGKTQEHSSIQVMPRIAFNNSIPIEVIDVVIPDGLQINMSNIHVHFTGNAAGGTHKVSFGGINAMVMAGTCIIEVGYQKATPQKVFWASLHGSELKETGFILHLLIAGGSKSAEISSIIFAKPEPRTNRAISIVRERKVNAQRALMDP